MYGLEFDEYFETPLQMQRFMLFVLAVTVVVLHPIVAYVIIFKSKTMSADMRAGYLILQVSQFLQDIFFCLLYQPYPLTPLPVVGCMGLLCGGEWVHPLKLLGIFGFFVNGCIAIYLSILLHIQQTLIIGPSRFQLSSRGQTCVIIALCAWTVWVVASFLCLTAEPANRAEVIQKLNASWLEDHSRYVVVIGSEIGDAGTFKKAVIKLAMHDIAVYVIMASLIFLILRELKTHAKFESAKKRLCRTSRALLTELLCGGLLYIFPTLCFVFFHLRPPLFVPDIIFFLARNLFVMCISVQSTASAFIFLSYHTYGWVNLTDDFRARICSSVSKREETISSI